MTISSQPTVVFITALPLEYQAVQAYLTELQEEPHSEGTLYEVGNYPCQTACWRVVVVEIGPGNPNAALETERAIHHFNPTYAFFVGVAGGIKDVNLGDVVAADVVKGYHRGKVTDKEFLPRGDVYRSSYRLVQRARVEARRPDWSSKIKPISEEGSRWCFKTKPETRKVQAYVATIAAGEQVIASINAEEYEFVKKTYSEAVAVDMEGTGFLTAINASSVQGIIIRGISDLLAKSASHDKKWQPIAAQNAAAFAFAMLDNLDVEQLLVNKLRKLEEYKEFFSEEDMAILRREIFIKYF